MLLMYTIVADDRPECPAISRRRNLIFSIAQVAFCALESNALRDLRYPAWKTVAVGRRGFILLAFRFWLDRRMIVDIDSIDHSKRKHVII